MGRMFDLFKEDPDFQFCNMNGESRSKYNEFGELRTEVELMKHKYDVACIEINKETIRLLESRK